MKFNILNSYLIIVQIVSAAPQDFNKVALQPTADADKVVLASYRASLNTNAIAVSNVSAFRGGVLSQTLTNLLPIFPKLDNFATKLASAHPITATILQKELVADWTALYGDVITVANRVTGGFIKDVSDNGYLNAAKQLGIDILHFIRISINSGRASRAKVTADVKETTNEIGNGLLKLIDASLSIYTTTKEEDVTDLNTLQGALAASVIAGFVAAVIDKVYTAAINPVADQLIPLDTLIYAKFLSALNAFLILQNPYLDTMSIQAREANILTIGEVVQEMIDIGAPTFGASAVILGRGLENVINV